MSPHKILVVMLDNLGDTVMATGVIRPLQILFPNAKISFWVKAYTAGLFSNSTSLYRIHASDPFWDKAPGHSKGSLVKFLKVLNEIRKEHYDAALLLNTEWRRTLATVAAGIPERMGFDRRKSGSLLTTKIPVPDLKQHFIDDHRLLVEQWAGKPMDPSLFIPHLQETAHQAHAQNTVVIHPFAGDPLKCWPVSNWNTLLANLHQQNNAQRFVVICGENEAAQAAVIVNSRPKGHVVLAIAPNLSLTKSLMQEASLFIGGDSGPGHIAAAIGTPVVSLFGPTDPARCEPRGRNKIHIIQKSRVADIAVADVLAAISKLSPISKDA